MLGGIVASILQRAAVICKCCEFIFAAEIERGVGKRGESCIPSLDATLFIGVAVCCHVERSTFAHPQLPFSIVTHDIHIIVKLRLIPRSFRTIFIVQFFPTCVALNHQIIALGKYCGNPQRFGHKRKFLTHVNLSSLCN